MTAIRSPLGVVIIVGLFMVLSVDTSARSDHQHTDAIFILIENNPPIANPQPETIPTAQLLDVVRLRSRIFGVLLDFVPDSLRVVAREAAQRLQSFAAISNLLHRSILA